MLLCVIPFFATSMLVLASTFKMRSPLPSISSSCSQDFPSPPALQLPRSAVSHEHFGIRSLLHGAENDPSIGNLTPTAVTASAIFEKEFDKPAKMSMFTDKDTKSREMVDRRNLLKPLPIPNAKD